VFLREIRAVHHDSRLLDGKDLRSLRLSESKARPP
jgi:hypothetical protein